MNSTVDKPSYTGSDNLDVMAAMSQYNRWIYETIAPYLGKHVLEAGCGNGNITRHILQNPCIERYVGVDMSEEFCERLTQTIPREKTNQWSFHAMALENPKLERLADETFDTIVCSNVLEHIEDDVDMLKRFYSMLAPQGRLILLVPAFQWLYGTIDVVDGHFRRYAKSELKRKLTDAHYNVESISYFNIAGIPAWFWHGKVLKLKTHTTGEMRLWDLAVPFLRRMESLIPTPAGLSVFAVAQRSK